MSCDSNTHTTYFLLNTNRNGLCEGEWKRASFATDGNKNDYQKKEMSLSRLFAHSIHRQVVKNRIVSQTDRKVHLNTLSLSPSLLGLPVFPAIKLTDILKI